MFRPKFDPFIVIWLIPDKKMKAYRKRNVVMCCQRRFPAAAGAAATGLWTEPQTAGEIVSSLLLRPVYLSFYKRKKKKKIFL